MKNVHILVKVLILGFIFPSCLFPKQQKFFNQRIRKASVSNWVDVCKESKGAILLIYSYRNHVDIFEPFRLPEQSVATGSGALISNDGYALTNFHVIENSVGIYAQTSLSGKERFELEFVGGCPQRDIALLKFTPEALKKYKKITNSSEMPFVDLGDSDKIVEAQPIMLLGHPGGEEEVKITVGYVKGRTVGSGGALIETTAPVNPGDSGGPFFDEAGKVIGLCVAKKINSECFGYIIPIKNIVLMFDDLLKNKILRLPFWGIGFGPTIQSTRDFMSCPEEGVYISMVTKGGLADKAGIKVGDIVVAVDGKRLDESGYLFVDWTDEKVSLIDYVNRCSIGSAIDIKLYRDGVVKTIKIVAQAREQAVVDYFYPCFESLPAYEIFAGMVVSELTLNHVIFMSQVGAIEPGLFKYTQEEEDLEPRLLITSIFNTSLLHLARVFPRRAALLKKINGAVVKTIKEFREAILSGKDKEFLTIEIDSGSFVALPLQDVLEDEKRLSDLYGYEKSSLVKLLQTA